MGVRWVVVGSGPAGTAAAATALSRGHAVTVVEAGGWGGNAVHHSLVPSKVLLEDAAEERAGGWTAWRQRQRAVTARLADETRAFLAGAQLLQGTAKLRLTAGRIQVVVDGRPLDDADRVVWAGGSLPRLVPGLPPDGRRVLIPRALAALAAPPPTVAVVGAGPTGLEAAALFARAGSRVELFTPHGRLLPDWAPPIGQRMERLLRHLGVTLHFWHRVVSLEAMGDDAVALVTESGRRHPAPQVLLATGRRSSLLPETCAELGLPLGPNGFPVADEAGRTVVPGLWLVGDAAGPPLLANRARWQGRRAVAAALGEAVPGVPPWVEAVYTHPDAARVRRPPTTPPEAPPRLVEVAPSPLTYRLWLAEQGQSPYLAVHTDPDGRVVGGEAFGPRAAEVMNVVALATAVGASLRDLAAALAASPTAGEWLLDLWP